MIEASRFEPSGGGESQGVPLLASCLARIWACAASAARGRSRFALLQYSHAQSTADGRSGRV